MSNYLSKPIETLEPWKPINSELVGQVLAAKQGQYNLAKQQINQTFDAFESLKVLRPEDQEYINNKIVNLKENLDNSVYKDFSDINLSDSISAKVKTAAQDPFIIKAMENTAKFNNFQQQVSKIREKNPKAFDGRNYEYALWKGGVDSYMKGDKIDIGQLEYQEYVDLTEENLKSLKMIKDIKGKRFIEQPDGRGVLVRKEIDGLTDGEIQEYFGSILTPPQLEQMKINGWYNYGRNEARAKEYFVEYNKEKLERYKDNLESAKANYKNAPKQLKGKYQSQIDIFDKYVENSQRSIDDADMLPIDEMAGILERDNYISGISKIASSEWSTSYELDPVWKAKQELALQYEDLKIKKAREEREKIEFGYKMAKEYGLDENGNPKTEGVITISTSPDKVEGADSNQDSFQDRHDYHYEEIITTARKMLNDLTGEDREAFVANLRKYGYDENLNVREGMKVKGSKASAIIKSFDEANLGKYQTYANSLHDNWVKKEKIAEDIIKIESASYKTTFEKDPELYVSSLFKTKGAIYSGNAINRDNTYLLNKNNLEKILGRDVKPSELLQSNLKNITNEIKEKVKNKQIDVRDIAKVSKKLYDDAKVTTEATYINEAKNKRLNTLSVNDDINFINENVRKQVIDAMPQTRIEGEPFDSKSPFTARVVGGNLVVTQYHGEASLTGGGMRKKQSSITLDKGDESYNIMMQYVDLDEKNRVGGYSAYEYTNFESKSPAVYGNTEKSGKSTYNAILTSVNNNPNIVELFRGAGGSPLAWATKDYIEYSMAEVVESVTNDSKKADEFAEKFADNLRYFKANVVSRVPEGATDPSKRHFWIDVVTPKGDTISRDLNISKLDIDTAYLTRYQPQTFISEIIATEIKNNPKFINEIF